jgi:CP family cyanate transporter-like MFS transporter
MTRAAPASVAGPRRSLALLLLWVAGFDVRLTLLAVPPVLPLIRRDLGLSEAWTGALTGLPIVLLAAAAVPGAFLIARLGAQRSAVAGILLLAVASGLRGVGPSAPVLVGMTVLMGVGIAIAQPAVPTLIGAWLPDRVGLATAVYVNGLLVSEALSASLTLPLVLPMGGGRWPAAFAIWAVPVFLTGLGMAWLMPRLPDAVVASRLRWSPDWRRLETWQLGLLLGGAGATYFGANAFIADFLRATGRAPLVGAALTVLNAIQLPAPLAAAVVRPGLAGTRGPLLASGAATLAGVALLLAPAPGEVVLGAAVVGFCAAFALVLSLSLPPALSAPGDVHRLAAGMFAIGYIYSFLTPMLGGAVWDASRRPAAAFLPVAIGALTVLAAAVAGGRAAGRREAEGREG